MAASSLLDCDGSPIVVNIPAEVRERVIRTLEELEHAYGIRVLLAVESGSRAWGLESPDSDFDVRGIYAHESQSDERGGEHGSTGEEERATLERLGLLSSLNSVRFTSGDHLIDVELWEVGHALRLTHSGNTMMPEWLRSPYTYFEAVKKDDGGCSCVCHVGFGHRRTARRARISDADSTCSCASCCVRHAGCSRTKKILRELVEAVRQPYSSNERTYSALRHNYGIMKSSLEFDLKATYPFLTTVRKSATELLETATKLQRAIKYSNVGEACVLARSAEECARGIESQLMTEEKTEGVTFTQERLPVLLKTKKLCYAVNAALRTAWILHVLSATTTTDVRSHAHEFPVHVPWLLQFLREANVLSVDVHDALRVLVCAKQRAEESHTDARVILGDAAFNTILSWLQDVDGAALNTLKHLHADDASKVRASESSAMDSKPRLHHHVVQLIKSL